jgi:hypothetical protein
MFNWKLISSFLLPVVFNNMVNLSEHLFFTQMESDIADILTLSGAVGIIFIQTYGAWMLFTHFENKKWGV